MVDYDTLIREKIAFLPPNEIIDAYKKDYEEMCNTMIYGDTIGFADLIKRLTELQNKINRI